MTRRVRRTTLDLVDRSRSTPANGDAPAAPTRALPTIVTVPAGDGAPAGALPLVVFATGFEGTSTNYAPLYDHWVEAGYVVAAPTFPISNRDAPGGPSVADMASQPADVRFVTGAVLAEAASSGSALHDSVDPERVAAVGKSLGAITVLRNGYDPDEHEPRFCAVVAMTGLAMQPVRFDRFATPLLLIHGDADELVPAQASIDAFAAAQRPKFLVTLPGVTHLGAFGGGDTAAEVVVAAAVRHFLDHYVKGDDTALERLERDAAIDGIAHLRAEP